MLVGRAHQDDAVRPFVGGEARAGAQTERRSTRGSWRAQQGGQLID